MTIEDVKWSFDRVINIKDQPAQYLTHVDRVEIVDPRTFDILLKQPDQPLLTIIVTPEFAVLEKKLVEAHGGNAGPNAKDDDKATPWLNENSAGTGAYRLTGWERNAQIQFVRNPHYWRGTPPFERVVIRHFSDSAAQLLALRRGDVDAAFNLIPEQIATLKSEPDVRVNRLTSLDFVYMALTQEPEFNKALAVKEARQAIGYAIDYDGIKNSLLGGAAVRPAHFLPIGMSGSTEEIAREIGFRQDLPRAKALLAKAGLPDGFEFEIAYGNADIAGVSYQIPRPEDPGGSGAGRHQGDAQSDGSGQPAHPVHDRQVARRRAHLLEPARGRERALGGGGRRAGRQARALDPARGRRQARA